MSGGGDTVPDDILKPIREKAQAILLVELAAMLHDLDKMEPGWLKTHNQDGHREPAERTVKLRQLVGSSAFLATAIELPGVLKEPTCLVGDYEVELVPDKNDLACGFIYHHARQPAAGRPKVTLPVVAHIIHAGGSGADGIDSALAKYESNQHAKAVDKWAKEICCVGDNLTDNKGHWIITPYGMPDASAGRVPWTVEGSPPRWRQDVQAVLRAAAEWASDPSGKRSAALQVFREVFARYLGDTRWPLNDVTLWAHSYSTASLAKAITAKLVIEGAQGSWSSEHPYCLPLRNPCRDQNGTAFCGLLVTLDRDGLLARAQKAGDVIGAVNLIAEVQEAVCKLLEEELPVGNVCFQDECRQLFLLPYLDTWPARPSSVPSHKAFEDAVRSSVGGRIVEILCRDGKERCPELAYNLDFSVPKLNNELRRQDEGDKTKEEHGWSNRMAETILKQSRDLLSTPRVCKPSAAALVQSRPNCPRDGLWVVCDICGVNYRRETDPQGCCERCHERRTGRAEKWAQEALQVSHEPMETIWLSEVLDATDNELAMIRASFDLGQVFDGSFFESCGAFVKGKDGEHQVKKAAPSRVRRCWETCQSFFDYLADEVLKGKECHLWDAPGLPGWRHTLRDRRLAIEFKEVCFKEVCPDEVSAKFTPRNSGEKIGPIALYRHGHKWLSAINLAALDEEFVREARGRKGSERDARLSDIEGEAGKLASRLKGATASVEWEDAKGKKRKSDNGIEVECACILPRPYAPMFEVTRSPLLWEFVVSASHAGAVVDTLVHAYRDWFGKVQFAIPISVGVIFFPEKFPLYLAIEAARRMRGPLEPASCGAEVAKTAKVDESTLLTLKWERIGQEGDCASPASVTMPATRPDGKPETFHGNLELVANSSPQSSPCFTAGGKAFCPHHKLKQGQQLNLRVGKFDFIFLDAAGRINDIMPREFRHPVLGLRPAYPIIVWDQFLRLGNLLLQLPKSQRSHIEGMLSAKRHEWRELPNYPGDPTVKSFCQALLLHGNAFGRKDRKTDKNVFTDEERDLLVAAAQNGLLLDAIEFFTRRTLFPEGGTKP